MKSSILFISGLLLIVTIACHNSAEKSGIVAEDDSVHIEMVDISGDVTSVNLSNGKVYVGLRSAEFICLDSVNHNNRMSFALPSIFKNIETNFVYPISDELEFFVGKRWRGVFYVKYDSAGLNNANRISTVRLTTDSNKGLDYSPLCILKTDKKEYLIGTSNGLIYCDSATVAAIRQKCQKSTTETVHLIAGQQNNPEFRIDSIWKYNEEYIIRQDSNGCYKYYTLNTESGTLSDMPRLLSKNPIAKERTYFIKRDSYGRTRLAFRQPIRDFISSIKQTMAVEGDDCAYVFNQGALFKIYSGGDYQHLCNTENMDSMTVCGYYNDSLYLFNEKGIYSISAEDEWLLGDIRKYRRVLSPNGGDRITAAAVKGDTIFVGTKFSVFTYIISSAQRKSLRFSEATDNDNPYFCFICPPYAYSLNDGLFYIMNDSVASKINCDGKFNKFISGSTLDYCNGHLLIKYGDSAYLGSKVKNKRIDIRPIPLIGEVRDCRWIDSSTIHILTADRILRYTMEGDSCTLKSAEKNTHYANKVLMISGKLVNLAPYRDAKGEPLVANKKITRQYFCLVVGVALFVLIVALGTHFIHQRTAKKKEKQHEEERDKLIDANRKLEDEKVIHEKCPYYYDYLDKGKAVLKILDDVGPEIANYYVLAEIKDLAEIFKFDTENPAVPSEDVYDIMEKNIDKITKLINKIINDAEAMLNNIDGSDASKGKYIQLLINLKEKNVKCEETKLGNKFRWAVDYLKDLDYITSTIRVVFKEIRKDWETETSAVPSVEKCNEICELYWTYKTVTISKPIFGEYDDSTILEANRKVFVLYITTTADAKEIRNAVARQGYYEKSEITGRISSEIIRKIRESKRSIGNNIIRTNNESNIAKILKENITSEYWEEDGDIVVSLPKRPFDLLWLALDTDVRKERKEDIKKFIAYLTATRKKTKIKHVN